MTKTLEDLKPDFPLLVEAGFVAVKQLDEISARRIFSAAQVLNPDSVAPMIGFGYIELNKLNVKEAAVIFRKIVEKEPNNHLAEAFLGICYLLTKKNAKKVNRSLKVSLTKQKMKLLLT